MDVAADAATVVGSDGLAANLTDASDIAAAGVASIDAGDITNGTGLLSNAASTLLVGSDGTAVTTDAAVADAAAVDAAVAVAVEAAVADAVVADAAVADAAAVDAAVAVAIEAAVTDAAVAEAALVDAVLDSTTGVAADGTV